MVDPLFLPEHLFLVRVHVAPINRALVTTQTVHIVRACPIADDRYRYQEKVAEDATCALKIVHFKLQTQIMPPKVPYLGLALAPDLKENHAHSLGRTKKQLRSGKYPHCVRYSKCSRTTAPLLIAGVAAPSFSTVSITALRMHLKVRPQSHLQLKQGVICRSPVSAELAGRLCEAVVAELRVELGAAQQLASVEGHIRILQPTAARKLRPLTWKELHQRSLLRHLRRAHLSASFRTRRRARRHPPPHDATIYAGCQVGWPAPAANEASMRLRASLRTVRHGMHRKYPGRISSDFRLGLVRRSPNANLAKASKMAAGRALGNG